MITITKDSENVTKVSGGYKYNGDLIADENLRIVIPLTINGNMIVKGNSIADNQLTVKGD